MKWYQHDPDAFIAGTYELTLEQVGAYILILNALYSRDGNLPDDENMIRAILRCEIRPARRLKKALINAGKIWVIDGKVHAKRVEHCLEVAAKLSQSQSKVAKIRWKKNNKNNEADMPARALQPQPHIRKKVEQISEPGGSALPAILTPSQVAERELFAVAKQVMGKSCGGLISSLIRHHNYDLTAARSVVDLAITKSDPREYLVATMRSKNSGRAGSVLEAAENFIQANGGHQLAREYEQEQEALNLDNRARADGPRLISKG